MNEKMPPKPGTASPRMIPSGMTPKALKIGVRLITGILLFTAAFATMMTL